MDRLHKKAIEIVVEHKRKLDRERQLTERRRILARSKAEKKRDKAKAKAKAKAKPTAKERENQLDAKYLEGRKNERVKGVTLKNVVQPKKILELAIKKNRDSKRYKAALEKLSSSEFPTDEQIAALQAAKIRGPNYLGRTASQTAGHKFQTWWSGSNGYTTQKLLMPAADSYRGEAVHPDMASMSQGEIIYMIGQHLIWNDIAGDEFLSYSIDPLFLVYHALGRHHKAQNGVTIQFIDRRRAKSVNGEPAAFYHALEIYDIFDVRDSAGWPKQTMGRLLPRKFTQEYLSHGTVKVDDARFQQATMDHLIRDGLYDLFPAFKVDTKEWRAGLYSGQVILRTIGYPPPVPVIDRKRKRRSEEEKLRVKQEKKKAKRIYAYHDCPRVIAFTVDILKLVQKLTRNFIKVGAGEDREVMEPPLHIFLCFLTFEKRPSRDEVFIEWIKTHYTASDVTDIYTNDAGAVQLGFTTIADNLPGVLQYLDLLRDAIFAFDLLELPENWVQDANNSTGREYAGEDDKKNRGKELSTEYDKDKQKDDRDSKKQKRHANEEKKREEEKEGGGKGLGGSKKGKKKARDGSEEADESMEGAVESDDGESSTSGSSSRVDVTPDAMDSDKESEGSSPQPTLQREPNSVQKASESTGGEPDFSEDEF